MFNQFYQKISQYDSIVILRHKRPDMDALGSQLGLKQLILDNFPNKQVLVDGDMTRECFLGSMDVVTDEIYKKSLVIITDVSVSSLIFDEKYNLAPEVIVFDHHKNACDIKNAIQYCDPTAAAACQVIVEFAIACKMQVSSSAATCLYAGMISDTNRFNFSLTPKLFEMAAKLIEFGADFQRIYDTIYADKVSNVKMRAYFTSKFIVNDCGVAYMFNDATIFDEFKVDVFTISRGMVNVMANLKEVDIWANFTEDPTTHKILCEFRSKKVVIVDIAKKYGGGGHNLACGATVDNFEIAKQIIEDFNELLKG